MKDVRTYNVRLDIKNKQILNENFEETLKELVNLKLKDKCDFKLNCIDSDMSSEVFNNVVNLYVEEVLKEKGSFADRVNAVANIQRFIKGLCNYMIVLKQKSIGLLEYNDVQIIELFRLNDNYIGKYFRVYLPKGTILPGRYKNLMVLGPDHLKGEFSQDVELDYIFPALFWFLYEVGEYANASYLRYEYYMFGLA